MEIRKLPRTIDRDRFFKYISYEPHEGQRVVHASRAERRVMACGVRFGKTTCATMEVAASALEPVERSVGWVVAPTYELSDRVFREVVHVFQTKFPHRVRQHSASDRKLLVTNMGGGTCEIRGKSADNPVSLLGEGLDWLVVDEAARLRPDVWQRYLSQRLVDKRGWAMLISTPRGKGWFYDIWRAGQPRWVKSGHESWNLPSWTNPGLDRSWIEAQKEHVPMPVWRQEYGAEFMEGAGQVFRGVRDCATGRARELAPGEVCVAGLDLAQVHDYTVLTILTAGEGRRSVLFVDRFTRMDWSQQVARIRAALARYGDPEVWIDSTGVGEPIYEMLLEAGCDVRPYVLTHSSKAALVNNLVLMLESGDVELLSPDEAPEVVDEMEGFEYSVTNAGNVTCSAPSGGHDDCVISLGLAAWGARDAGIPEVQFF